MIYKKLCLFALSIGILAVNSQQVAVVSEIETHEAPKFENILNGVAVKANPYEIENDQKTKNNGIIEHILRTVTNNILTELTNYIVEGNDDLYENVLRMCALPKYCKPDNSKFPVICDMCNKIKSVKASKRSRTNQENHFNPRHEETLHPKEEIKDRHRKRDVNSQHKNIDYQRENDDNRREKYSRHNKKEKANYGIKESRNVDFKEQIIDIIRNKLSKDVSVEIIDLVNLPNRNRKNYRHQNSDESLADRISLDYTYAFGNSKIASSEKYTSSFNEKSNPDRLLKPIINKLKSSSSIDKADRKVSRIVKNNDKTERKGLYNVEGRTYRPKPKKKSTELDEYLYLLETTRTDILNSNKRNHRDDNKAAYEIQKIIDNLNTKYRPLNKKYLKTHSKLKGLEHDRKQKSYSVDYDHNIQVMTDPLNKWLDILDSKRRNKVNNKSYSAAHNNEEKEEDFLKNDYIMKNTGQVLSLLNQNQIRFFKTLVKELKDKFDDDELMAQVYDLLFGVPAVKHYHFVRSKKHPTITEQLKKNNRNKRIKMKINGGRSQNGPSITDQLNEPEAIVFKRIKKELNKRPARPKPSKVLGRWGRKQRWKRLRQGSNERRRNGEKNRYGVHFEMNLQGLANLKHA